MREFGKKAFRRPLDAGEQQRYETLLAREHDFLKGAQLVVEAMLQSPNFLFWLEYHARPANEGLGCRQPAVLLGLGHHARR